MGVVDIANLGLDSKCSFSSSAYLNWLNKVLSQRVSTNSNRQMLMMYKAHYLWRLEQKNQAVAFLNETFAVDPRNPTPLFLACEWSLDENMATSNEICPKALEAAKNIPYKFDALTTKVKNRFGTYTLNLKGADAD